MWWGNSFDLPCYLTDPYPSQTSCNPPLSPTRPARIIAGSEAAAEPERHASHGQRVAIADGSGLAGEKELCGRSCRDQDVGGQHCFPNIGYLDRLAFLVLQLFSLVLSGINMVSESNSTTYKYRSGATDFARNEFDQWFRNLPSSQLLSSIKYPSSSWTRLLNCPGMTHPSKSDCRQLSEL